MHTCVCVCVCVCVSHLQVDSGVHAEGGVLGGEGAARALHQPGAARAGVAVGDELLVQTAVRAGVVGLTDGQEVGRQTARHHLARVHKDVCRTQPEGKHTWSRDE